MTQPRFSTEWERQEYERQHANKFYGWFDDASQKTATYDPRFDGPCLFCGRPLQVHDVRTFNLMFVGPIYAKRSYFYRTHRTCSELDMQKPTQAPMDAFIFDMIERNGD